MPGQRRLNALDGSRDGRVRASKFLRDLGRSTSPLTKRRFHPTYVPRELDPAPQASRLQGECPGPHESTTPNLSRPDDLLRHLGVQHRSHVSTAVVSNGLAAGLWIQRPDLPLLRRGVDQDCRAAASSQPSGFRSPGGSQVAYIGAPCLAIHRKLRLCLCTAA